jgi:uncharacterized protein YndB with AHSA1/START domain
MSAGDWSKFCIRINTKATIQQVYDSWTTQAALEKWFLRKAEFTQPDKTIRNRNSPIQKDDTYEWMWFGYSDDVAERGKILEVNGSDSLQFTFASQCIVTVKINSEEGETIVELCQENIPADENPKTNLYVGCGQGWTFYFANLKSLLEGGIDLRNKNEKLTALINA